MKSDYRWVVLVLGFACAPALAGDDTQFTLVVDREYRTLSGRIVNQTVYVNDKYVGSVPSGTRLRFSIPINASGNYAVNVRTPTVSWMTGGDNASFSAKAGDEVVVKTGFDLATWVDATKIFSVHVYPSRPAEINIVPPWSGLTLSLNGREERFSAARVITTTEKATENRCIRLECKSSAGGEFLLFARPGSASVLDFSSANSRGDGSLIASIQFLLQLRNCVAFHLGHDLNDLAASLGELEKDLTKLRTDGVRDGARSLRDQQVAYFHKIKELAEKSPIAEPAVGLVCSALQCAGEAMLTGSAPSKSDMLFSSAWATLKAGYNKYQINAEWSAADAEFGKAEEEVTTALKNEAHQRPSLRKNPLIRQWIGGADFLGKWAFTFEPKLGRPRGGCYCMEPDGSLVELVPDDDSVKPMKATYTTDGNSIVIHWDSGSVETGQIDVIDRDHLTYRILEHSSDPTQVGMTLAFARVSAGSGNGASPGWGVVTIRNTTGLRLQYQERWAGADGAWSAWNSVTIEPGSTHEAFRSASFGHEVLIDESLENGEQTATYLLPVNVSFRTPNPQGDDGRRYRFELSGGKVTLVTDRP